MGRVPVTVLALSIALGASLVAAAAPAPRPAAVGPAFAQNADACLDSEEQAFLSQLNAHRAANGLPALKASHKLDGASAYHSADMADDNYFSHDLNDGTSWSQNMTNFGYTANTYRGENIAAGNSTGSGTFTQWRNSPGHNANMLGANFTVVGIGRAYNAGSTYKWYWTTDFGGYDYGASDAGVLCGGSAPTPTPVAASTSTPRPAPTATGVPAATAYAIRSGTRTSGSNSSSYAYDNRTSTAWITNSTGSGTPRSSAYVYFDLGAEKPIGRVEWMFGVSGYADSLQIQVSTNRSTWTTIGTVSNATALTWQSLNAGGTSARYVRFYFANPNGDPQLGSLAEVKIWP